MASDARSPQGKHILFLDADCVFCQRSTRILHRWDTRRNLYFTTIQGETAAMLPDDWKNLTDNKGRPAGTAVLVESAGTSKERRWREADAILASLRLAGGPLALFWTLHYIPGFLKNGVYRILARNRHRLTFTKRACPLPDQHFKDQFLP